MARFNATASERAFLGAVVNGDARASGRGLVESDFTDGFCKRLFAACVQLEAQGKIADLVTLCDTLPDGDSAEIIGIAQEAAGSGVIADQHAENVRSAGQRRRVSEMFLRGARAAQDASIPLEETIFEARGYLDKTSVQTGTGDFTSGTDALCDFHLWLDSSEDEDAISTGLSQIDSLLCGGLKGGRLYVIGARTSVGKSALMGYMAVQAIRQGRRVLYVSLEMQDRENVARMVASVSGVSLGRINNRSTLSDGDRRTICEAYALIPGENFRFSTRARTPEAIRRAALRMRAQAGLDLIVVDYLQILQPDGKASSRVEAVGQITGALKLLAMELNVPVLSAAQINRAGVQAGNAPRLSDLRESGSIEQDADVVFLMHRPDGQEQETRKRIEFAVAKNRQGRTGFSNLIFDGALMRFYLLEDRRRQDDRSA